MINAFTEMQYCKCTRNSTAKRQLLSLGRYAHMNYAIDLYMEHVMPSQTNLFAITATHNRETIHEVNAVNNCHKQLNLRDN